MTTATLQDMRAWADALNQVAAELADWSAPEPPARGTRRAAERAVQLKEMELWLLHALLGAAQQHGAPSQDPIAAQDGNSPTSP